MQPIAQTQPGIPNDLESLCQAACEILQRKKLIAIPAVFSYFPKPKESVLISEAVTIPITDVCVSDTYVPDTKLLLLHAGQRELCVLFALKKKPGADIREWFSEKKVSAVLIDVTSCDFPMTEEHLSYLLFRDCKDEKTWLYNVAAEIYYHKFYHHAEKLRIVAIGMQEYVADCPQMCHTIRDIHYASPGEDCSNCRFCLSYYDEEHLWCTGRRGIAYKSDFAKTEEQRLSEMRKSIDRRMKQKAEERCPRCGSHLEDCASEIGIVRRCTEYPNCEYVKADPLFYVMRKREY